MSPIPDVSEMKSPHAKYSVGDPQWTAVEPTVPATPSPLPDIYTLRAVEQMGKQQKIAARIVPAPVEGLIIEDRKIDVNGATIPIRIYSPVGEETFPLLVYFHGGGFATGDIDSSDPTCREVSVGNKIVVINVDYRLAPEFTFPTGVMDCYETVKWGVKNAKEIKVDVKKGVIVGGISSGANFAASVALMARDDPDFANAPITGQLLQTPPTCAEEAYPEKYKDELQSRFDLANAPIINLEMLRYFDGLVRPKEGMDVTDTRVSVMLAKTHEGLPPAYVQISGRDPLRDEGLVYHKILEESGVKTQLVIYPGLPHSFAVFAPMLAASKKWREDTAKGIEWLLSAEK